MKQVIVIRKDLNMRKGKMCAQAAHASMAVLLNGSMDQHIGDRGDGVNVWAKTIIYTEDIKEWLNDKFTKICVGCDSEEEIRKLEAHADELGLMHALIEDVGRTEFNGVPTVTALAIGPDEEDRIDAVTGHLKLL